MNIFVGHKTPQYYQGLLIKADLGLHEQIADVVKRTVPAGGRVLDLGTGEGALAARLADMGFVITAADKDAASFRCTRAEFIVLDFDDSEAIERFVRGREALYDAVLGVEVIEHVQDQWRYARQLARMAKPGGLILITTPNISSWLSRGQFLFTGRFHQFGDQDRSYGHIHPIAPAELELVLRDAGVENVTVRPAGTLPALFLPGLNRVAVLSLLMLVLRPFLRGVIDGWCVIATGRRLQSIETGPG